MTADRDGRSSGWVPSGLSPVPLDEAAVRAAAFTDIDLNDPPKPVGPKPSVIAQSPLAARIRQETDQIAEHLDAVVALEAPRGPVPGKRREWSDEDRARIVAEAKRDGGRVVMARYQLAGSVLNRWIRETRAGRKTTPTRVVPKAVDRPESTPPPVARPTGTERATVARPDPPEVMSPEDALGAAIGHLRWHRDHLAAKLAKVDAALAALEDLGDAS